MELRLDLQHSKLEVFKVYYIQVVKIISWQKEVVLVEGLYICKWRYKISCEEWQRQVGWDEEGKAFAWKYMIPTTAKKNKYWGSSYLSFNTNLGVLCHIDSKISKTMKSTLTH